MRKEEPVDVLLRAIDKVHEGEIRLDHPSIGNVMNTLPGGHDAEIADHAKVASLTPEEHDVIATVVRCKDATSRLLADTNPFALVTAAHLLTRQTRHDAQCRFEAKRRLVRVLYERGWDKRRILSLFAVLDWMMQLPKELEAKLWHDIESIEGERKVRYVTSVERLAIERGMQKGIEKGIEKGFEKGIEKGRLEGESIILHRQLTRRFGPLSPEIRERLTSADAGQLETWADRVLDARSLEEVFVDN